MGLDDAYSKVLLHFDGADESNTITDESGRAWTAAGNAQIDTAQSVFGGASLLLDGTGDYVYTADDDEWRLDDGSNDNLWTIDLRVRFNGDPGTDIMGFVSQVANSDNRWGFGISNNTLYFISRAGAVTTINLSWAWNPAGDTWYHVALVKQGATGYRMFVDGTQIGEPQTDTSTMQAALNGNLCIGRLMSSTTYYYMNGWIDECRISKGIARWTSNFTPPTRSYGSAAGGIIFL